MLGDQIALLRLHVQEFGRRAQSGSDEIPRLLTEAFRDLQSSIDELEVVDDELRQQEEELIQTRANLEREGRRYRELFHQAPDAGLVTDLSGMILDANPRASAFFAVGLPYLVGKPVTTYVDIGDRPAFRQRLRRCANGETSGEWMVRFSPRSGRAVLAEVQVVRISDETGQPTNLLWLVREARHERLIEEQASRGGAIDPASPEAAHARYAYLLRVTDQLTASLDYTTTLQNVAAVFVQRFAERAVVYAVWDSADALANGGAMVTRLLATDGQREWSIQEVGIRSVAEALSAEASECLSQGGVRIFGRGPDYIARLIREWDAEGRHLLAEADALVVVPLIVQERPVAVAILGISAERAKFLSDDRDLLEEVAERAAIALDHAGAFRQASESSRQRDALISIFSHDLRNPLMVLQGYLHITGRALEGKVTQESPLASALPRMRGAIAQIARQLDDLTVVARIGAGRPLVMSAAPVDLVALARQVVVDIQAATDHHRIDLVARADSVIARADRAQIERVLANLVNNALKYSPRDTLVTVEVGRDAETAIIAVRDQGMGVPSDEVPRIFEFFYRASNVADRTRGSGIGLASAAQIVALHGGRIEVESQQGAGSTFIVRLPLA